MNLGRLATYGPLILGMCLLSSAPPALAQGDDPLAAANKVGGAAAPAGPAAPAAPAAIRYKDKDGSWKDYTPPAAKPGQGTIRGTDPATGQDRVISGPVDKFRGDPSRGSVSGIDPKTGNPKVVAGPIDRFRGKPGMRYRDEKGQWRNYVPPNPRPGDISYKDKDGKWKPYTPPKKQPGRGKITGKDPATGVPKIVAGPANRFRGKPGTGYISGKDPKTGTPKVVGGKRK